MRDAVLAVRADAVEVRRQRLDHAQDADLRARRRAPEAARRVALDEARALQLLEDRDRLGRRRLGVRLDLRDGRRLGARHAEEHPDRALRAPLSGRAAGGARDVRLEDVRQLDAGEDQRPRQEERQDREEHEPDRPRDQVHPQHGRDVEAERDAQELEREGDRGSGDRRRAWSARGRSAGT